MPAEEIRRRVLDAIEGGRVPRGGPSELAAHGLIDDAPPGYWERWTRAATERIRGQVPPATKQVSEKTMWEARQHRELVHLTLELGLTHVSELEAMAPAELRPEWPRTVIPTDRLLEWAQGAMERIRRQIDGEG